MAALKHYSQQDIITILKKFKELPTEIQLTVLNVSLWNSPDGFQGFLRYALTGKGDWLHNAIHSLKKPEIESNDDNISYKSEQMFEDDIPF